MEVLRPDASVQNICIKAAPRADPNLELPFLRSVVNAVVSSVTGRVAIVGLVDPCMLPSHWTLFPASQTPHLPMRWERDPCPTPWDPEEIVSVQYFQPARSVSYVVALNLPLWESRSQMPLRDSWHEYVARHMESKRSSYVSVGSQSSTASLTPFVFRTDVQFYERTL